MSMVVIILGDSFADFCRRRAHDGICRSIVVRIAGENLNAEGSLLENDGAAVERLIHDISEQARAAFAIAKQGARQHPLKLAPDRLSLALGRKAGRNLGDSGVLHRTVLERNSTTDG